MGNHHSNTNFVILRSDVPELTQESLYWVSDDPKEDQFSGEVKTAVDPLQNS
jgi:hypothetical protein